MDPLLSLLLSAVTGAACATGGSWVLLRRNVPLRRREVAEQVEKELVVQRSLDAIGKRQAIQAAELLDTANKVEQLRLEQGGLARALGGASGQLEQLERFATTAAAEVAAVRQQLATPQAPAPQLWQQPDPSVVQRFTAVPVAGGSGATAPAGVAELMNLQRVAQAEFARRQRNAAEAAFQQPPGGQ